jgi:arylsulfatase A-like enzyme
MQAIPAPRMTNEGRRGARRRTVARLWASVIALIPVVGLACATREKHPPVIVLMLDTLRADHLGFYGYERDTSPNLDAFARENVAFKYAFTAAPWTPASVATMLTGLYPSAHGFMPPNSHEEARLRLARLSPALETLPEVLRDGGYATAAVSSNPWIRSEFGFEQGFETFRYLSATRASDVVAAGLDAIDRMSRKSQSFFLYLHFLDPHNPYAPPTPYDQMFPVALRRSEPRYNDAALDAIRRYDGEVRYLDGELGRLFTSLRERGLYDRAIIIVIADHGEQFWEHGSPYHGNALHNEEVHVPFFLRDPRSGRRGEASDQVVSTVDLFPTILGLLEMASPAGQRDGVSVFDQDALAKRAGVASEIRRVTDQRAFITRERKKVIFDVPLVPRGRPAERARLWKTPKLVGLFDLQTDYFDRRPLDDRAAVAELQSSVLTLFTEAVRTKVDRAPAPHAALGKEELEQLKALGYLN